MKTRILCAVLAAALLLSGCVKNNNEQGGAVPVEKENLAVGCLYTYDYGVTVTGDDGLSALTDGKKDNFVTLCTETDKIDLDFSDWYGNNHTVAMDNNFLVLSLDLGFVTDISKIGLAMDGYEKRAISLYASNDGYNFTQYLGDFNSFEGENFSVAIKLQAKAIQFVIPADAAETVKIGEIIVEGMREHKKTAYAATISTENIPDAITKKAGQVLHLDLGAEKNISEVLLNCGQADLRINVRYSSDRESWTDLGQSFLYAQGTENRYLVTRNHTVNARYIDIYTYAHNLTDVQVSVFGCEKAVAEPDYGYTVKAEQLSDTNVAPYGQVTFNGEKTQLLSDMLFAKYISGARGSNQVTVELEKTYDNLCGMAINCTTDAVKEATITVDGKPVSFTQYAAPAPGSTTRFFYFNEKVAGSKVELTFQTTIAEVIEVMVYDRQPSVPMARGGFFQLPTSGGNNPAALNSDYTWYLQLKGMRDLGMEYVIIQYSSHFLAKTTLIDGENIKALGFTYNATYGSADVCQTVLDAAQKLGMKVYLGTVHDSDFNKPLEYMPTYGPIVEAGKAMITDIEALYGDHPAFAGYYLSDETCDLWLNLEGGVEAARYVYKGQSDHIRQIDPDAKIMIAPAIWRSGEPEVGAEHLYEMIKPEKEGEKPVADIVAAQDCLGREQTLVVTNKAYASFERYVELWAKAVRKAGAEFWHDAEVFEVTYSAKRYEEVVKSLHIEAKTSGSIIVFDIPHYFSTYSMGSVQDPKNCIKTRIMRDYVRFYHGVTEFDTFQLKKHTAAFCSTVLFLMIKPCRWPGRCRRSGPRHFPSRRTDGSGRHPRRRLPAARR